MASASVGTADGLVPMLHRELTGDQSGTQVMVIFEDFEQIAPVLFRQQRQAEVNKHEQQKDHAQLVAAVQARVQTDTHLRGLPLPLALYWRALLDAHTLGPHGNQRSAERRHCAGAAA